MKAEIRCVVDTNVCDVIITGDDDLLELNPFRGIPILKPRDFLEWVDN